MKSVKADLPKKSASLTIGQVAARAGVGVETVRFYEREGILSPPPRRASGYREFPLEAVERIRFTRRAKGLGFSLTEIKDMLAMRVHPETTCREFRQKAETKIAEIEAKIAGLTRMQAALKRLAASCGKTKSLSDCPILEALEEDSSDNGGGQ